MGAQVERQSRENRGAEGTEKVGCGEGCPLPHWDEAWGGGCEPVPPPGILFSNFYTKMMSFRGFWVAISYCL